jgi:hypothetical protein
MDPRLEAIAVGSIGEALQAVVTFRQDSLKIRWTAAPVVVSHKHSLNNVCQISEQG